MAKEHRPTAAMRKAAAEGIALHKGGADAGTPRAIEVGKKIAAGHKLSENHISDMAHFHASHDCNGDCEDMLWGGPAGEHWANSKMVQAMNIGFSEEDIDFEKLMNDENVNLSLEVFSDNLDEPTVADEESGLVWAPILRSGMLATRPGPNGEKLDEPLVFIPGHSEDQSKAIGLQDIVDAFDDKAIEYVTVPTSHENQMLDNTGFIRELKIVDSTKHPGEKVILGGHEFTEPDIKGKIERGTIPSRSCGILYDYKNTTTGKVYPAALDHVCLTPKPWMGGLAPYGTNAVFSDERTIVSLRLSEKPFEIPIEAEKPTEKIKETAVVTQEFLADVQWGDQPSHGDVHKHISQMLDGISGSPDGDFYPRYHLHDATDDKALVGVRYNPDDDENNADHWIAPYSVENGHAQLSPFSDWQDVHQKWVSLSEEGTDLAVLTSASRDKLPSSAFVYPAKKAYPIHDIEHGRAALSMVAKNGSPAEQATVKAAVYKKYPQLNKNSESKSNMAESDPLKIASALRSTQPPGGQMETPLLMSEEQIDLLGLSEEAKEIVNKQQAALRVQAEQLAESQKKANETRVEKEIGDLKDEGFDAFPGLLKEIEATLMSDDGDIALKLQLSDHGHSTTVAETATQIVQRFVKAIPREDGKVALGEFANKTETPALDRPEDKPQVDEKDVPENADALLSSWVAADPSLANDPLMAGLKLSENGKGN